MTPKPSASRYRRALTLIEIMMVMVLVMLLTLVAWASYSKWITRADSLACMQRLRNLGTALNNYIADKHEWPQEPGTDDDNVEVSEDQLWDWWMDTMKPYGMDVNSWFCPAELRMKKKEKKGEAQEQMGVTAGLKDPSYIPDQIPAGEYEPYRYPGQPWAVERSDFHGDGQAKLMPGGERIEKEVIFSNMKRQ
jgi:type II secretory pathway pseudopilin PulG